jgi:hypothetical protein
MIITILMKKNKIIIIINLMMKIKEAPTIIINKAITTIDNKILIKMTEMKKINQMYIHLNY